MQQSTKTEITEKEKQEEFLKKVWDNPIGKIGITAVSIVGITLFIGGLLKVGAFTVGAYKDFRDVNKR